MLHHIIVKWTGETDKAALALRTRQLYKVANEIDGINKVEIKENVTPRKNRYDIMIVLDMDDNALSHWDESELHKRWKKEFSEMIEKKCIFDC